MSFKIYKYPLRVQNEQTLELPRGAKMLSLQPQPQTDGQLHLCLWALVPTEAPMEERTFRVVETGQELSDDLIEKFTHLDTFQMMEPRHTEDGESVLKSIVHHVFVERAVLN